MKLNEVIKKLKSNEEEFKVTILSNPNLKRDVMRSIKDIAFNNKHLKKEEIEELIYKKHKISAQVYFELHRNKMYVVI